MKNKRGIQIILNFSNRAIYTFIAIAILLVIGAGVYASTFANSLTGVGHDASEIQELDPTVNTYIKDKSSCESITGSADLCDGVDSEFSGYEKIVQEQKTLTGTGSDFDVYAYCSEGKRIISGGCSSCKSNAVIQRFQPLINQPIIDPLIGSFKEVRDAWQCKFNVLPTQSCRHTAIAICATVTGGPQLSIGILDPPFFPGDLIAS